MEEYIPYGISGWGGRGGGAADGAAQIWAETPRGLTGPGGIRADRVEIRRWALRGSDGIDAEPRSSNSRAGMSSWVGR